MIASAALGCTRLGAGPDGGPRSEAGPWPDDAPPTDGHTRDGALDGGSLDDAGRSDAGASPLDLPRLEDGGFTYLGNFRLPDEWWSWGIGYGGPGELIAMNPQVSGVRRYAIPEVGGTARQVGGTATLPSWGESGNGWIMGGSIRFGGRIYAGRFQMYDVEDTPHMFQTIAEDLSGDWTAPQGPEDRGQPLRGLVGSFGVIPPAYRALFDGYELFAANVAGKSIISNSSWGPSFMPFDAGAWARGGTIPSLLPLAYAAGGGDVADAERLLAEPHTIAGCGIVPGTRTLIAFGVEPGSSCYGTGVACGDPCSDSSGFHGHPYRTVVYAFDLRDLHAVLDGRLERWEVEPYNVGVGPIGGPRGWTLPGVSDCYTTYNKSGFFDPDSRRIYMTDAWHDSPVDVWQIDV